MKTVHTVLLGLSVIVILIVVAAISGNGGGAVNLHGAPVGVIDNQPGLIDEAQADAQNEIAEENNEVNDLTILETDHVQGPADATVTWIEYSDFECPFCRKLHPVLEQALEEFPEDFRWVNRHFPLTSHSNAIEAAVASECAADQGAFWEYGEALFANQNKLGKKLYPQIAEDLELDVETFEACLAVGDTSKVEANRLSGSRLGVTGTPGSIIVANGTAQRTAGALSIEQVRSIINELVQN